ncbi:MAG: response regulator [Acidobacteria bacterium]|nr:response regulator [Acidobacteriota bacterium]
MPDLSFPPPPSRALSIAVSVALVVVWATIRLVVFDTIIFPLTYAIPLLVCVWTRDRVALWSMAAAFVVLHAWKLLVILPDGALADEMKWANLAATLLNIAIGGVVVHLLIGLRGRLDAAMTDLAAHHEELAQQNEELTQQSEELANQNEELQAFSEESIAAATALQNRERLLDALFEAARVSGGEHEGLTQIVRSAFELFGDTCCAAAVFESRGDVTLEPTALAVNGVSQPPADLVPGGLASLVFHENRTAALDDVALRPDLAPASLPVPVHAMLCAPIRFNDTASGVVAIYCSRVHEWRDSDFKLLEWLADLCGRLLQTLRLQAALRQADQQKSEFLATLSHELRNPLAPIRYALKLIDQGGPEDRAIGVLHRQVQQLVRLVDDLLDATRLSSNKIQLRRAHIDLNAIVRHAVDALMPEVDGAEQRLDLRLPSAPVWLDADADRLSQVITNLLNNAIRYTPPGGRLGVDVSTSGDEALLSVTDTGIGLDVADLHRVFDMFTQTGGPGSGGLGLGLAIVRGIVDLHGGRVEAHSDGMGRGSQFRVFLPMSPIRRADVGPAIDGAAVPARPQRVLVVDDNADSAEMLAALLRAYGHAVNVAYDAEGGLRAAGERAFDVALLDIGLPGIDGYELARRLRGSQQPALRLVAITGWGQDHDRARARDAGFDAHLTKPAEPDAVLAVIAGKGAEGG